MAQELNVAEVLGAALAALKEETDRMLLAVPWWRRGSSCFVAFCVVNAAALFWAAALVWVRPSFGVVAVVVGSLTVAAIIALYQAGRGAR